MTGVPGRRRDRPVTHLSLPRCQHCDGMLLTEFARSSHERMCLDNPNRETMAKRDEVENPSKRPQPYTCNRCGKVFWSERARDAHQDNCSLDTD